MFELMFCSILPILPDCAYRRYWHGKRIGQEITLVSVWYELRRGITACLLLTVSLVTAMFNFHPASSNVTSFYRIIPVLPESGGRVTEINVGVNEDVTQGQPLFRLDSSVQQVALETSQQTVAEFDAQMRVAEADLITADGRIQESQSAHDQALEELASKQELRARNLDIVTTREIERLQNVVDRRFWALAAAKSNKAALEATLTSLRPVQKGSAIAQVAQAQSALDKAVIYAGVDGTMQQFTLRVGEYVDPMIRPAGILVPEGAGGVAFVAGFGQISAQVLKVGMTAEMSCESKPPVVIPMVVTEFQEVISSSQLRQTDQLIDATQVVTPGSILVYMDPTFEGGVDGIPPGSTCFAKAYTSNHDRLQTEEMGEGSRLALHAVDTVGLVHAMLMRLQVLIVPVTSHVFSGGH